MKIRHSPLLSARLSVDYPKKPGVLRDIALDIEPGEVLGLVGQSGSGKSTLALALMGLLPMRGARVNGKVMFLGENLLGKTERELRVLRGNRMSIVLQSPLTSLNPALSVGDQLEEAWRAHARGSREQCLAALRTALESVCLPSEAEFLARRPAQLSVGQGQRVMIAMAILHRPALLIADEPTSALDTITQSEILRLFAQLNRDLGTAMLYISHDLLSVAALCHRIAILQGSQIVESGSPEEIFESPRQEYTRQLVAALPRRPVRRDALSDDRWDLEKMLADSAVLSTTEE
ncbi:MAG TPA: ABC transporter ATP-binding protein [Patescibacteria group bacterium]|nr:ABC transporter ATP-binding protein [Patescibacteria group bacterium]